MVVRKPSTRFFGLGTRLLLLGLIGVFPVFFAIKNYLSNFDDFLIRGQQEALLEKSLTFSAALNGQNGLFDFPQNIGNSLNGDVGTILNYVWDTRSIVPYRLDNPIILDGNLDDWNSTANALNYLKTYSTDNLLSSRAGYDPFSLSFQNMVGTFGDFLYALFIVDDDKVIYRANNSLNLEKSDNLQIALVNQDGKFMHYTLAPFKQDVLPFTKTPIYINAFSTGEGANIATLYPENKIQAVVSQTLFGYLIELRIHKSLVGDKLAFAIADVDQESGEVKSLIGTAGVKKMNDLGTILVGSPKISQILNNFNDSQSRVLRNNNQLLGTRIWIADKDCTVRAYAGSLNDSEIEKDTDTSIFSTLFRKFLAKPVYDFEDLPESTGCKTNPVINQVITEGSTNVDRRLSSDDKTVILSAYAPVNDSQGQIVGIVGVESSLARLIRERNKSIESLFGDVFFALSFSFVALLIFAFWLTSRIRKLSYDTNTASSTEGKVIRANLVGNKWSDELGDLSRTISNQWRQMGEYNKKLESYNQYLGQYKDKLRHEMQTPTSVVKSSLELIAMENKDKEISPFIQRAQQGSDSLSHLLQSLSQAKNIEGAVKNEQKEWFNLTQEIKNYADNFQEVYPNQTFSLNITNRKILMNGTAWLIRQMLDKVVDNAVEFSSKNQKIDFSLTASSDFKNIIFKVENFGPLLPEKMSEYIFDFMVSVREVKNKKAHLGLGLYMAQLIAQFHNGSIKAKNNETLNGVIVEISIPISNEAIFDE